jgi:hypothetical protein
MGLPDFSETIGEFSRSLRGIGFEFLDEDLDGGGSQGKPPEFRYTDSRASSGEILAG